MVEYFLGIGQSKRSVDWLTRQFPNITFHEAAPYLVGSKNSEFIEIGMSTVASALKNQAIDTIYAESQAAPAVVQAILKKKIPAPKKLVLIQPLGLNSRALGSDQKSQYNSLMVRSRLFWRHKDQALSIAGNRWTCLELIRQSLRHPFHLKAAFLYGASQDISEVIVELAAYIDVEIYASDNDMPFPYQEILDQNPSLRPYMRKIGGTHLNRATPRGVAELSRILADTEST